MTESSAAPEPVVPEPAAPEATASDVAVSDPAVSEPDVSEAPEAVEPEPAPEPTWRRFDLALETDAALSAAVEAVRAGEVIVLPTDTVYGVAANATDAAAVQRLLNAKVRGRDMPPPVLISDAIMLGSLSDEVPDAVHELTARHWPGALTVILKAQPSIGMDLGETNGTIAVRVPDHETTRALLRRTGPLAVSSANVSGNPAATAVDDAIDQLGESISVYLDGGPTPGLAPSSIIDFSTQPTGRLVRLGALSIDDLREVLPELDLGEFAPEPEPEPEPEVEAEPEPEAAPEPEVEAAPEAETETTSETEITPEAEPEAAEPQSETSQS